MTKYERKEEEKLKEHNLICNFKRKLIYKDKITCSLVHTDTFMCNKVWAFGAFGD